MLGIDANSPEGCGRAHFPLGADGAGKEKSFSDEGRRTMGPALE